jgi:hypothetical protein
MNLYVGNSKKLKVNLDGQVRKIMDPVADYATMVIAGEKDLNDIPEAFRAQVELLVTKAN